MKNKMTKMLLKICRKTLYLSSLRVKIKTLIFITKFIDLLIFIKCIVHLFLVKFTLFKNYQI